MDDSRATNRRARRKPKPLDRQRLEELALAYVSRFATSAGKLKEYLHRKLRERGFEEGSDPEVEELVSRFAARGYVDDQVYSRARADDLTARGYGARRVEQTLRAAGIDDITRSEVEPGEAKRREAALIYARKRRIGPFATKVELEFEMARKEREKRLAAMLRAGHDFAIARWVVEAGTVEELEQWVAEAMEGSD